MRNDQKFNIIFVKCIERYPCLWNHNMKEYSRRTITDSAWNEIAKEMQESGNNCRERWKNIRAAFVRSRRPVITDSGIRHKKTYYLNKHLQFLIPYTKSHPGTLTTPDEYMFEIEEIDPLQESAKHLTSEIDIDDKKSIIDNVTHKIIKPTSSNHQEYQYLAHENQTNSGFAEWANAEESNPQADDDPDLHFFQSLLPDVRKLSDKKKRNFKKTVIDVLDKLLDDDDN